MEALHACSGRSPSQEGGCAAGAEMAEKWGMIYAEVADALFVFFLSLFLCWFEVIRRIRALWPETPFLTSLGWVRQGAPHWATVVFPYLPLEPLRAFFSTLLATVFAESFPFVAFFCCCRVLAVLGRVTRTPDDTKTDKGIYFNNTNKLLSARTIVWIKNNRSNFLNQCNSMKLIKLINRRLPLHLPQRNRHGLNAR